MVTKADKLARRGPEKTTKLERNWSSSKNKVLRLILYKVGFEENIYLLWRYPKKVSTYAAVLSEIKSEELRKRKISLTTVAVTVIVLTLIAIK